jgi:membrane protein required for beta-lactamase induction
MTVLAILVALFVERLLQQHRPLRRQRWLDVHCARVSGIAAVRRLVGHPWGAFAGLLPPLLVIAGLQAFFDELGPLFSLAFTTLVLLDSLGPRDLGGDAQAFVNARDTGQDRRAQVLADSEFASVEIASPRVVEDALALIWRSLATRVALIAGGGLVAALA